MLQLKLIWIIVIIPFIMEADTTSIKWHSSGAPLISPDAWLDNYMPCARDLITFPVDYPAILPLPTEISIGGFVLPRRGAVLLAEDATIHLASGTGLNEECGSDERRAYIKPPKTSKWFDPNSWSEQTDSSTTVARNSFVPELERVPCDDEHVVIMGNSGALSFDLENVEFLRLGQLIVAGSSISKMYLQELLHRDLGQLLFHNAETVTVEYYTDELCGCHKNFEELVESVCHNVESQCERPHCVKPILPYGSCCYQCGALMILPERNCIEEDRKTLFNFINNAMIKDGLDEDLLLHVDYVNSEHYGNMLQAIVLDRGEYSERSVQFMQRLSAQRNESILLSNAANLALKFAGSHYNPNVTFASVLLILFCVVFVAVVSIIMLAHFMPENPYLNRIPQWIHDPRRWRWRHLGMRLRRNLLFNRFDNVGTGAAGGSVAERLAVIGYDAESGQVRERAFNNPMFEQKLETEAQTQSSTEAQSQHKSEAGVLPSSVETGELDSCSVEEQELTEINLESSESDTDEEAETKE